MLVAASAFTMVISFLCWLLPSFEIQGILSPIQIDGVTLHHWKMYPLTFNSLDNLPKLQLITQMPDVRASKVSVIHGHSEKKFQESSFYLNGKSPHSNNSASCFPQKPKTSASSKMFRRLICMHIWSSYNSQAQFMVHHGSCMGNSSPLG